VRRFMFTRALIIVYNRMTNAVLSVEVKKKAFWCFGHRRAA